MSKSHKLAWAAGFIDGDGYMKLQKRGGGRMSSHYVLLGASQVNIKPLQQLQSLFGGNIRKKNSGPNKDGFNRKQQYVWTVCTQKALDAIEQIYPYLIHKDDVAKLLLEYGKTIRSSNTRKISQEVYDSRELIHQEIIRLNAKD